MKAPILPLLIISAAASVNISANPADAQTQAKNQSQVQAYAQSHTQRPCVNVTIQRDPINQASIEQHCQTNISRVVQLGETNSTETVQSGLRNDSKVRQIQKSNLGQGAQLPTAPRYR